MTKPFRVSVEHLYFAHDPGADDGQPLAVRIMDRIGQKRFASFTEPELVYEIADVASLWVYEQDDPGDRTFTRCREVYKRACCWLKDNGLDGPKP